MPYSMLPIIKLLGLPAARWVLSMAPNWIERRWYPDAKLAEEISIRTTLAEEGPTLRFETWHGIPRLGVRFIVQNGSLYQDVRVDRLLVSVNDGFDLIFEGWAAEMPPAIIQMIATLTAEQAAWLKSITGSLQLKGIAQFMCNGRVLKKRFHLTEKLNVTS